VLLAADRSFIVTVEERLPICYRVGLALNHPDSPFGPPDTRRMLSDKTPTIDIDNYFSITA
jgi:hypothetical protein